MLCDRQSFWNTLSLVLGFVLGECLGVAFCHRYWAGITLYPTTKATPERAADMVEIYGPDRILVNSSADWGPSDPLAVPRFMFTMRRRGHPEPLIRQVVYDNPLTFFSQSAHFNFRRPD